MSIPVDKQELLAFEAMQAAATDPEQLAALELLFQHAAFGRNAHHERFVDALENRQGGEKKRRRQNAEDDPFFF